MNRTVQSQRGMTLIGWLIVLGLIAFIALITIRLVPVYLEYYRIASVLESMKSEPMVTRKAVPEVRQLLERRFTIDDVRSLTARDVKINQQSGVLELSVSYEVRTPMLGNIDAVASFDKKVKVISP